MKNQWLLPLPCKFVLCIRIGFLIDQKKQSAFSIDIFLYSTWSFSETTALDSTIKFWIDGFILLDLDNSYVEHFSIFPSFSNLHFPRMRKGPNNIPNCRFLNPKCSKSTGANSSGKVFVEIVLSIMGCKSVSLYVRSIFFTPHWEKISQCDCVSCFFLDFLSFCCNLCLGFWLLAPLLA